MKIVSGDSSALNLINIYVECVGDVVFNQVFDTSPALTPSTMATALNTRVEGDHSKTLTSSI